VIQTNNFLACAAGEPRRHYEAIRKLDFNVVVDLFMTPTAQAVADIVLPAGPFLKKIPSSPPGFPQCHPKSGGGGRMQVGLGDQLRISQAIQPGDRSLE